MKTEKPIQNDLQAVKKLIRDQQSVNFDDKNSSGVQIRPPELTPEFIEHLKYLAATR